jgi:putative endonuclease
MFVVYVLQSTVAAPRYTGSATDAQVRLERHNAGLSRSTKAWRPWVIVHQEFFETRAQVMRRERFLKAGRGREELNRLLAVRSSAG